MGDNGSKVRAFLAELRRRRVFRVAVVYAIVTFGILQVADIAFPALRLPEWSITLVVALTLLGFPVAVVLAWAFDITPKGVVRTEPLAGTPAYAAPSRALALSAVAVVLVVTVAVGWYILPKLPGWWTEGGTVAESGGSRKMLVVLPFVNLGSPVDQYFADGITEEITARLASITGLGVIARTSALRYKETEKTVQEIGAELGVEYVLEGTVRWENRPEGQSRVRVTPQLIRVTDATHVWAEIYEEPLASVFEVQSEIAEKVADALDVTLMEPERRALEAEPTRNLEAYSYYLRGNEYLQSSRTQAGAEEALAMFEKAVELDPDFEEARRKLAQVHADLYWASFRMLFSIREQDYQETLERLDPESFGSDTGSYLLAKAILYERAQEGPSAQAYFDSARAYLEPRVALSPGDSRLHAQLGLALAGLGRAGAAVGEGRRAVELLPVSEDAYAGAALLDNLAHIYMMVGDYDAAIAELEALLAADAPVSVPWLLADPTWDPLRDHPRFESLIEAG
jgi:adenylate cyclase